jgi:hypothetical protein
MSDSPDGPAPPDGLPDRLVSELHRLSASDLRKTIIHAQELLQAQKEPGSAIEPQAGEDIIEITEQDGYTEVIKRVPCGEDCEECPHGPYIYHVIEEARPDGENRLHWQFIGRKPGSDS